MIAASTTDPAPDVAPPAGGPTRQGRVLATIATVALMVALGVPVGALWVANRSGANASDSAQVGLNRLGAAELDIELGSTTGALTATNLAPGDRVPGSIDVTNRGDLPLRYAVSVVVGDGALGRWLRLDAWISDTCAATPDPATMLVERMPLVAGRIPIAGDVASGADPGDRSLRVGDTERLCLVAELPLDAPNEAQLTEVDLEFVIDAEHDIDPDPTGDDDTGDTRSVDDPAPETPS